MIRVKWNLYEAVTLLALYLEAPTPSVISDDTLLELSEIYKKKATENGIVFDSKFRNISGLKMQLACIQYVVSNGTEGMANASKIFYQAYDLYKNDPDTFFRIRTDFLERYRI